MGDCSELTSFKDMIEVHGPQASGSVENIPFETDGVQLALKLAVDMASRRPVEDTVNEVMLQVLETMWVVGHPDAISPTIIGELKARNAIWKDHDWEVVHDGNAARTLIAKA